MELGATNRSSGNKKPEIFPSFEANDSALLSAIINAFMLPIISRLDGCNKDIIILSSVMRQDLISLLYQGSTF